MSDTVTAAITSVDYESWVTAGNGERVPQSSNPAVIEAMLRLLDLQPGMRVLELGTGSGYSTALLAGAVGAGGRVVSLDIDPGLTTHAREKHQRAGHRQVEIHTGDGRSGWPGAAPYDRVIAWSTPARLPSAWIEQVRPGGIIVSPVNIAEVAMAHAVVRCHVVDGRPQAGSLHPGSFVEMTPDPDHALGLPAHHIDAVAYAEAGPSAWLSAVALRGRHDPALALVGKLATATPQVGFDVDAGEHGSFIAYLLATATAPASAGTLQGWGIGLATADSVAVVLPDGAVLTAGTRAAYQALVSTRDRWWEWHRPSSDGYDRLTVTTVQTPDDWQIGAVLPESR